MKQIITALTILTVALLAQAREMTSWSYQELYDQADLVVIAKPISTQDTTEKAVLPNISPDVHVVGLSTQFDISVVMKGDKHLKKCVLHHFRLTNPKEIMINGPMLASFDPEQHTRFLLSCIERLTGVIRQCPDRPTPLCFPCKNWKGRFRGLMKQGGASRLKGCPCGCARTRQDGRPTKHQPSSLTCAIKANANLAQPSHRKPAGWRWMAFGMTGPAILISRVRGFLRDVNTMTFR